MINIIEGGITASKGFGAASCHAGIKKKKAKDMTLIFSKVPCAAAGVFSDNIIQSPSVKWDKQNLLSGGPMQAILITSGNANALNGSEGINNCKAAADAVGFKQLISDESVLIASSGEIGVPLPMDKVFNGVKYLGDNVDSSLMAGTEAARAILTRDVAPKEIAFSFTLSDGTLCTIGGCCKGSSVARSDMGTILAFITTDIAISDELLQSVLENDVAETYAMIAKETGDSPNDAVLMMANGMAGNEVLTEKNEDFQLFAEVLHAVNSSLAEKIAVDSEDRLSLFTCKVSSAKSRHFAKKMAKYVAGSLQTRMMFRENSKEWGAVIASMGNCGMDYDIDKVDISIDSRFGNLMIAEKGKILNYDRKMAEAVMSAEEFTLNIVMNAGDFDARAWGRGLYIIDVDKEGPEEVD